MPIQVSERVSPNKFTFCHNSCHVYDLIPMNDKELTLQKEKYVNVKLDLTMTKRIIMSLNPTDN
jgi:hypothetical protein